MSRKHQGVVADTGLGPEDKSDMSPEDVANVEKIARETGQTFNEAKASIAEFAVEVLGESPSEAAAEIADDDQGDPDANGL